MRIGNRDFDTEHHCYVMGILDVTPDSRSDGGDLSEPDAALAHAEKMIAEGADLIDIGGQSTRPGHVALSEEEEIGRILPVIEAVKSRFDIPVSVDTYKGKVTEAALRAGADLVNDIWGFRHDFRVAELTAQYGVPCCLMHNRFQPVYDRFLADVIHDLEESVALAKKAGVEDGKIIVDPGIGFGKTYEQNLELLEHLEIFRRLGYPVLLGTSRKAVIGQTLDLPTDERVEGTVATTVMAVMKGVSFVRVHDVKENKRAIQMAEAVRDSRGAVDRWA